MKLEESVLHEITGGGVSGTLISAVIKAATLLVDLGRAVGSAIRTAQTGYKC